MIGPFCTHRFICLNMGFWYGSFVWKWWVFSILVLSTKKLYSKFLKNVFVSRKFVLKLKYWKRSKCPLRTCRSLKRSAILKIPSIVFQKNLCSLCWLYNETFDRKRFPMLRQKPTQISPCNLLKGSSIHFYCLFDDSLFSNICTLWYVTMECIELL